MVPKHMQDQKDLMVSLADRVHQRAEEHKERGGLPAEVDEKLLARARLRGWKPVNERRALKAAG